MHAARETAYAVTAACRNGPWRPRCLLRSLVLGWFLERRGIPYEIRIGFPVGTSVTVDRGDMDFSAHAWVEHDGAVLNDRPDIAKLHKVFEHLDVGSE